MIDGFSCPIACAMPRQPFPNQVTTRQGEHTPHLVNSSINSMGTSKCVVSVVCNNGGMSLRCDGGTMNWILAILSISAMFVPAADGIDR